MPDTIPISQTKELASVDSVNNVTGLIGISNSRIKKISTNDLTDQMTSRLSTTYLKYTGAQTLTDTQKAQVRTNLGLASQGDLTGFLAITGGTMTGSINMGSSKITNLATPTNNNDAANKKYVDDKITALEARLTEAINTALSTTLNNPY